MAHAEHFLERLERLEGEQVELALRLYYDHRLVASLLRHVDLPEAVDRVAISLDDDQDGPFIIVTRDGKFVTCLGRGMKHDRPIVTRSRMDKIAEKVESLRALVSGSKKDFAYTKRFGWNVVQAGDRLSREEFQRVAGWLPLLGPTFFTAMLDRYHRTNEIAAQIHRVKKIGSRYDELLHDYWAGTWAMSHFALMLVYDNGESLGIVLANRNPNQRRPRLTSLFPRMLSQLGVSSFAARGAWGASKIPKLILQDLKEGWAAADTIETTIGHGIGLAAVGLRHAQRRAEVGKLLRRPPPEPIPGGAELVAVLARIREMIAHAYEAGTEHGEVLQQANIATARMLLDKAGEGRPLVARWYKAVPDDAAIALYMSLPFALVGDYVGLSSVLQWMPWIVRAEVADLYLPEAYLALRPGKWQRAEGLAVLQPRLDQEPKPVVPKPRPPRPGRNEPCPCGSGKKFKRCCGDPAVADRE